MRKIVALIVCAWAITLCVFIGGQEHEKSIKASDAYIRDRVVMLRTDQGSCTGIQVKAPSGKFYILTAGHCKALLTNYKTTAITEDGKSHTVRALNIDLAHDLMLMTSAENKGIEISAKAPKLYEKAHTITHGHGMAAYRTDGEMLQEMEMFVLESLEQIPTCGRHRYERIVQGFLFGQACQVTYTVVMGTPKVVPGSSGGPVLNAAGELIGIVSATNGDFSAFIPLRFIKALLKGR